MSRFWHEFWPQVIAVSFAVGVAGNLAASLLWALPAFRHLHRKLNRQHRDRMDQAERHHRHLLSALERQAEPSAEYHSHGEEAGS